MVSKDAVWQDLAVLSLLTPMNPTARDLFRKITAGIAENGIIGYKDPGDRIIVAIVLACQVPLSTAGEKLLTIPELHCSWSATFL